MGNISFFIAVTVILAGIIGIFQLIRWASDRIRDQLIRIQLELDTMRQQDEKFMYTLANAKIPLKAIAEAQRRVAEKKRTQDKRPRTRYVSQEERFEQGMVKSVVDDLSGAPDKINGAAIADSTIDDD